MSKPFQVMVKHYLPTHCPPKSQRSLPLAAGISFVTVRPPTRSICMATQAQNLFQLKSNHLDSAFGTDLWAQTFAFQYEYFQLGIPFPEPMSCSQSRESGANNNNVPNVRRHAQAPLNKSGFASAAACVHFSCTYQSSYLCGFHNGALWNWELWPTWHRTGLV